MVLGKPVARIRGCGLELRVGGTWRGVMLASVLAAACGDGGVHVVESSGAAGEPFRPDAVGAPAKPRAARRDSSEAPVSPGAPQGEPGDSGDVNGDEPTEADEVNGDAPADSVEEAESGEAPESAPPAESNGSEGDVEAAAAEALPSVDAPSNVQVEDPESIEPGDALDEGLVPIPVPAPVPAAPEVAPVEIPEPHPSDPRPPNRPSGETTPADDEESITPVPVPEESGAEPISGGGSGALPVGGTLPAFHVAVIGSSTAAGIGASSGDAAWVNRLEADLLSSVATRVSVSNFAVGGYSAYELLPGSGERGSIDVAIADAPDLILVALAGSNDLTPEITTETFMAQLETLRDTAQAAGIPTFFFSTLPKNMSSGDHSADLG